MNWFGNGEAAERRTRGIAIDEGRGFESHWCCEAFPDRAISSSTWLCFIGQQLKGTPGARKTSQDVLMSVENDRGANQQVGASKGDEGFIYDLTQL